MSFKSSFSKMLTYFAQCDPYSYYIPFPPEENEEQTSTKIDSKT
jgi:hypothetical protein